MSMIRCAFMGSCEFSLKVLQLFSPHVAMVGVFTAPPKPQGRHHRVEKSCVHNYAEIQGWEIATPTSLRKNPDAIKTLQTWNVDVAVVASYGYILPEEILSIPKRGCLNVHPSLLPRWRGASPVNYTLLHGDKWAGVCLMQMDTGMDTGDLLWRVGIPTPQNMDAKALSQQLATIGGEALVHLLPLYCQNQIHPIPQEKDGVTLAPKLKKEDAELTWENSAFLLVQKILAFTPWPGTWGSIRGHHHEKRLHIVSAKALEYSPGMEAPGTIVSYTGKKGIVCGDNSILIPKMVKPDGGKLMEWEDFLRGFLSKDPL